MKDHICPVCNNPFIPKATLVAMKMFQSDNTSIIFYMLRHKCKNPCFGGLVQSEESMFVGSTYRQIFQKYRGKFK